MTPHELNLSIQAYSERIKHESEERVTQAYATALWQRVRKMPQLSEILKREEPQKEQTDEQMLEMIKALNIAMGGNVKRREEPENGSCT